MKRMKFFPLFKILAVILGIVRGIRGSNTCHSGTQLVTNAQDCRNAAIELGMRFATIGNWHTSPKGCLTSEWDGRQIYFNQHLVGSEHQKQAPICFKTGNQFHSYTARA